MEITVQTPWSAAFVSYVVRTALGTDKFPGRNSHAAYADSIRKNPGKYPFDVLDPFDTAIYPLRVGDIIVANRGNTQLLFNSPVWNTGTAETHGDIIVSSTKRATSWTYTAVGGNLSQKVNTSRPPAPLSPFTLSHDREGFQTLGRQYFVVLRPKKQSIFDVGESERGIAIATVANRELNKWKNAGWVETDPRAYTTLQAYWAATGEQLGNSLLSTPIATVPPVPQSISAISPYITTNQSFHPNIQYELTRRRFSTETANAYMPFFKLTSLVRVEGTNLPDNITKAWCPSLGIQGERSVTFNNLYTPQNNRSVVGYATNKDGRNYFRVPVLVDKSAIETDQENIPTPGILNVTTEKSTAGPMGVRGGLFRANVKILAYSTGQVDALLKYFLRPSTRVVLEFGRVSSNPEEQPITPFNWNTKDESAIKTEIENFIFPQSTPPDQETFQQKFIREKVYNNFGNYEIYIGYVVNFKLKYTKNNQFEIDLTVHSVQQYEIPTRLSGAKSTCKSPTEPCKITDVKNYFDEAQSWRQNSFAKLMEQVLLENARLSAWKNDVVPLKDPASTTAANTRPPGVNNRNVMGNNNGYLVTWRFFVEVLLNDQDNGIISVFPTDDSRKYAKLGLLTPTTEVISCDNTQIIANEVGYHPALRSTNPSVLIIYNETAQNQEAIVGFNRVQILARENNIELDLDDNTVEQSIMRNRPFTNICGDKTESGTGLLTDGIWLNTKAIVDVFSRVDTITAGLNALLVELNNATQGYWNLQLLSNDNTNPGLHVIDMGLSKTVNQVTAPANILKLSPEETLTNREQVIKQQFGDPVKGTPEFLYLFNRKTTTLADDDIGSELLDVNVEFNLPQIIAVQAIAGVGGVAQNSTLNSIDVAGLKKLSIINTGSDCETSPCVDDILDTCAGDPLLNVARNTVLAPADATAVASPGQQRQTVFNDQTLQDALLQSLNSSVNPNFINVVRENSNYGMALQFIEFNTNSLINKLTKPAQGCAPGNAASPNAFNSSNLTKTVIDLTMPGIGGIQLFQAFLVDRIPSILKKGYYIVTKINHEFTPNTGWITKIQGRFRYSPKAGDPQ